MGKESNISFTDHSFNGWYGCTPVGPGCEHCFAESWAKRAGKDFSQRTRTSVKNWNDPPRWNARHAEFFAAHGRRQIVLTETLGDVFDKEAPASWRKDLIALQRRTPNLDWLILTKRIGNVERMLQEVGEELPPNVRLGISVVNQTEANRDILRLLRLQVPNFINFGPLLGPVDLRRLPWPKGQVPDGADPRGFDPFTYLGGIDCVALEGESGPQARPMHPRWVFRLRDQVRAAGKPFNFKQWGEWVPRSEIFHTFEDGLSCSDMDPSCERWPRTIRLTERGHDGRELAHSGEGEHVYMQRVGVDFAGRLLQGVLYDDLPPTPPGALSAASEASARQRQRA